MDRHIIGCALIATATMLSASANGAFIYKDSEDFARQYNAVDGHLPQDDPGLAFTAGQQQGSPSVSGGVLTYQTGSGQNNYWDANGWSANPTVGWTIEVEVHMQSIQVGNSAFALFAGAGTTQSAGEFRILADSVSWGGTAFPTANNQNGFHVFRIAQEANSNQTSIWRNGHLIGSAVGTHALNNSYFGDGASGFSGRANIKYVRYDTTGAYTPIPEPGAAALVLAGAAGLMLRRQRSFTKVQQ